MHPSVKLPRAIKELLKDTDKQVKQELANGICAKQKMYLSFIAVQPQS